MRSIFDYIFVKFYQWSELLNRSYRKFNIAWEEDSLWCAIFGLSVLQSIQIFSIGIVLYCLFGWNEYVLLVRNYLSESVECIIFLFIWIAPLEMFQYLNRKRYKDKTNFNKIMVKYQTNKVSNIWAVLYSVMTWSIFISLVLYVLK